MSISSTPSTAIFTEVSNLSQNQFDKTGMSAPVALLRTSSSGMDNDHARVPVAYEDSRTAVLRFLTSSNTYNFAYMCCLFALFFKAPKNPEQTCLRVRLEPFVSDCQNRSGD